MADLRGHLIGSSDGGGGALVDESESRVPEHSFVNVTSRRRHGVSPSQEPVRPLPSRGHPQTSPEPTRWGAGR